MKQTTLSKRETPLLDSAISKLTPGVFSHPVWVRFGNKDESIPPGTIKDLFIEAENLRQNNPSDACQVLLICAVYQNHSGQTTGALTTIQKAQALAERTGLGQEILWALWGACAICVQHRMLDQAANHLTALKRLLSEQNDWILAEFVDIIKQTLLQPATDGKIKQSRPRENQPLESLLSLTFQWLNQWGFSVQTLNWDSNPPINQVSSQASTRSLLSLRGWQGRWRSLRLMFKGELKLHWADIRTKPGKRQSSFWGFILSLLHVEITSQGNDAQITDIDSESSESTIFPPPNDNSSIITLDPEYQTDTLETHINNFELSEESPSNISISVHMLGNFNVTVQETGLKLPFSRSLSLLKYMMLNHKQNMPREILMDVFWPDVAPERARNNLNVAMNGIRRALRIVTGIPVILYKDNAYRIASDLQFWLDVEEFELLVKAGQRLEAQDKLTAAVSEYEAAISLYQGDFLEENPYEGWAVLPREHLRIAYLDTLDRLNQIYYHQNHYAMCITLSQLILTRDRCREDAYCMLMRCYSRQGQDHLALRQYQACVEALRLELDVTPAPETTRLFEQIRQHKRV